MNIQDDKVIEPGIGLLSQIKNEKNILYYKPFSEEQLKSILDMLLPGEIEKLIEENIKLTNNTITIIPKKQ